MKKVLLSIALLGLLASTAHPMRDEENTQKISEPTCITSETAIASTILAGIAGGAITFGAIKLLEKYGYIKWKDASKTERMIKTTLAVLAGAGTTGGLVGWGLYQFTPGKLNTKAYRLEAHYLVEVMNFSKKLNDDKTTLEKIDRTHKFIIKCLEEAKALHIAVAKHSTYDIAKKVTGHTNKSDVYTENLMEIIKTIDREIDKGNQTFNLIKEGIA